MKCEICGKDFENTDTCPHCNTNETFVEKDEKEIVDYKADSIDGEDAQQSDSEILQETVDITVTQEIVSTIVAEKSFCKYCGKEIIAGNNYCSSCGRSTISENERHCSNCGLLLDEKQKFCTKCGTKIINSIVFSNTDTLFKKVRQILFKNKNLIKIIIPAIIALFVLAGICSTVLPKIFVTPYEMMEVADYEKAYKRAKSEEKDLVLYENVIAKNCNEIKGNLKNPESFKLNEVWIDKENHRFVLKVSGTNSYGGTVSSYRYYTFDKDDFEYSLWLSVNDFEEEKVYSFDDAEEKIEKTLKNIYKPIIKGIVQDDSLRVDNGIEERINTLKENGLLNSVVLIDEVYKIYPDLSETSDKT